jgi:hypothetical protein
MRLLAGLSTSHATIYRIDKVDIMLESGHEADIIFFNIQKGSDYII